MRFSKRHIAMASVLLASTFAWGQQFDINGPTSLLVRMSFASSWVSSGFGSLPQVCFSVDRSGHYKMRRVTIKTSTEPLQDSPNSKVVVGTPHTQVLQGTLPAKELRTLDTLLGDPDFRSLEGPFGGLVRKGAETFVAEVPRENGVQRVVLSDADRENPFPPSADRIVKWLQNFKAEGSEPLEVSAEDICPTRALQPVKPATALLQPIP